MIEAPNGWDEYKLLVLHRLETLEREVRGVRGDIANLKRRAGLWGMIGSALPSLGAVLYVLIGK